jgi:chemotaxis protein CheD
VATKIIGIAECSVSADASDVLTTYGLGSCIAVTMYDPVARVGGMLHFLLPDQTTAETTRGRANPYVYADSGVAGLIGHCIQVGAAKRRLRVYSAGGANVMKVAAYFDVGTRNHLSLRKVLRSHGLPLHAEAVGGHCCRTVRLHIATGEVWVREGANPEIDLAARKS